MKRRILFIFHVSYIGGGSWCLLRMVRALNHEYFNPVVILKTDGDLAEELRGIGVEVHIEPTIHAVPHCKSLFSFKSIWHYLQAFISIRKIAYWIRQTQADIVHLNTMLMYPYLLAAHRVGQPAVLHAREHWPKDQYKLQFRLLQHFAQKYAAAIVAINHTTSDILGLQDKTTVIHDWIDFEGQDKAADLQGSYNLNPLFHKIFFYIGGIQPIKGALEIVKAFLEADLGNETRLLFVGGMPRTYNLIKGTMRKLLRLLGRPTYSDRIYRIMLDNPEKIIAIPPTDQVKFLIEQCYAMISFATRPHAILPLAEAAWLGKAAIAADTPESREYTNDGTGAILVPIHDRYALKTALERLAADPKLAAELGQRGQAYVREIFDKERNVTLLEKVYRELA